MRCEMITTVTCPRAGQGLADEPLGASVHRAGRLVQDDELGIADQRPCDGEALLLPAREGAATLTHESVVTLGHLDDVLVEVARLRGLDDLALFEIPEELDVVAHRGLQEHRSWGTSATMLCASPLEIAAVSTPPIVA